MSNILAKIDDEIRGDIYILRNTKTIRQIKQFRLSKIREYYEKNKRLSMNDTLCLQSYLKIMYSDSKRDKKEVKQIKL